MYDERILLEKQMKYVDSERYAAFDLLQHLFDNANEMFLKTHVRDKQLGLLIVALVGSHIH